MTSKHESEAPCDTNTLKGKWILVCRTSGRHRLPSYQRLTSTGPWSNDPSTWTPLDHQDVWARDVLPLPFDSRDDIIQYNTACSDAITRGLHHPYPTKGGYGAKIVFLQTNPMPWSHSVATDFIASDCSDPQQALSVVQQWINDQHNYQIWLKQHGNNPSANIHDSGDINMNNITNSPELSTTTLSTTISSPSWSPDPTRTYHPDFTSFTACVSIDDYSLLSCAYICEHLNLKGTSYGLTTNIKNKASLRHYCECIGVPVPQSMLFRASDLISGRLESLLCPSSSSSHSQSDTKDVNNSIEISATTNTYTSLPPPPKQCIDIFQPNNPYHLLPEDKRPTTPCELSLLLTPPNPSTDDEWSQYYNDKRIQFGSTPLQYPIVIKPLSGASSNFVRKAFSYSDLVRALITFQSQCSHVNGNTNITSIPDHLMSQPEHGNNNNNDDDDDDTTKFLSDADKEMIKTKWKFWGLDTFDSGFMIEECIIGHEFDLDMVIDNGIIHVAQTVDNFPCAGHADYFMEAGGMVGSRMAFKQHLGTKIMANMIVSFFSQYLLRILSPVLLSNNNNNDTDNTTTTTNQSSSPLILAPYYTPGSVTQNGIILPNHNTNNPNIIASYPLPEYLARHNITGSWHFEGMIATNLKYLSKYNYGIMVGNSYIDNMPQHNEWTTPYGPDITRDDYYACVPIEINQRPGGSEVLSLGAVATGIDYGAQQVLLASGISMPYYNSYLPQYEPLNKLGYNRFKDSPSYDATIIHADDLGEHASEHPVYDPNEYIWPDIDTSRNPRHNDSLEILPHSLPLYTGLPAPHTLQHRLEHIPYTTAISLATYYSQSLCHNTPSYIYSPGHNAFKRPLYASSINFTPPYGGTINTVYLPSRVVLDPTYRGSLLWWPYGHRIHVPPLGFDCLGWLVATGATPQQCQENLWRLCHELRWSLEDPEYIVNK